MLKNFWFQAHWLIGITAGVILAIVGLTGGILSFETEIQDWLNRDVRRVEAASQPSLSPAELVASVTRQLPDRQIQSVQLSSDPTDSARVTIAPSGNAAQGAGGGGRGRGETRYVNPYTGVLIEGAGTQGQGFFRSTRSVHRWLTLGDFGSQAVGKQLVGASTLLCVVLALSGLYLRWPRRSTDWRTWLTFDSSLKGRSFLWHLHAVLGTWVLVAFLLMSLTGLYWSYDWYRNGLYALSGVERPAPRGEGGGAQRAERDGAARRNGGEPAERRERARAPSPPSSEALTNAWILFEKETSQTGFKTATINLPREPGRPIEIRYVDADPAHERANNTLTVDAARSEVVKHERYDDKRTGEKFMSSIFPLHSGSFFGLPGVVLYMVASLAMPVFTITGWMLYLDRRRKKKAARAAERKVADGSGTAPALANEPLLLGFASQAGFARELAWQTAGALQAAGVRVEVHPLERLDRDKLGRAKRALFVVSTFGDGEPPDDARPFLRRLMTETVSLADLRFGVLALGDRQFKSFCEFGRSLHRWLDAQGAQPLFPTVEVDKQDPLALKAWHEQLGLLTNGQAVAAYQSKPFHTARLAERRLLNPDSLGMPTYHIELEDVPGSWQAGDIVEIEVSANAMREYSIASIASDARIHLVVRCVTKPDGSLGLGSALLTQTAIGDPIKIRVRSNPTFHAPADDVPMILIGNGTGIAGLRSHLRARAARRGSRNWLLFGERSRNVDFYYRNEIESWQTDGVLERTSLAFSRDQAERMYVQHALLREQALVQSWVSAGAAIYVCGSIEGMAPSVEAALVQILGENALEQLRESGRYRRDVY